jgi:phosphoribosylformylglycinamidine synthase
MARVGIVVFPGSNCDHDIHHVLNKVVKLESEYVWHTSEAVENFDAIILPGGFSFGDRLRAGIIAAHSPVMKKIKKLADDGVPILGICNGFQILVESGLLPGALLMNKGLQFVCQWTKIEVVNAKTPFTNMFKIGAVIDVPVAHGEGRYTVHEDNYREFRRNNQIVLKYKNYNPNGSMDSIAGIANEAGNVVGIMPHPERASEDVLLPPGLGNSAVFIFRSLLYFLTKQNITDFKHVMQKC